MINFKFLKVQLKNTWLILVLFSLASILVFSFDLLGNKTLSPYTYFYSNSGQSGSSGAGTLIFWAMVVSCTMALSFALSILLTYKLFIKEIDRGYIGSWLTLPMSKFNVYITKLLVVISYIFIFHSVSLIFQEIIFAISMKDFSIKASLFFFTLNISMFLCTLLFVSLSLFLISKFDRHVISLAVLSVAATLFVIFYILYIINSEASSPFHIFKYFTILLFIQNPLMFDTNNPIKVVINAHEWYQYYPIIINWTDLAWKIIIPILGLAPLFIFSIHFFNKKNLSI